MSKTGVGRKIKVPEEEVIQLFVQNKDKLFVDKKVIGKNDDVWKNMAQELDGRISARTLYSKMFQSKFREKLNEPINVLRRDSSSSSDVLEEEDSIVKENNVLEIEVFADKEEFSKLIRKVEYKRTHKGRASVRHCFRLVPGKWEDMLRHEIYMETKLECGFNMKNHVLAREGKSGNINGYCNCGSTLKCNIDNESFENCVRFKCTIMKGSGKCGKTYLRQPLREEVAKLLCSKPAEIYRIDEAVKLMSEGDPEHPKLKNLNVLKNAKCEYKRSNYLDPDPRLAIEKLKHSTLANIVHHIGLSPFTVHFWSRHQIAIYMQYAKRGWVTITIEASGGMIKKITIMDGVKTKVIYLYIIVIHTEAGQILVAQMITESHDTNSIEFFLLEWTKSGAPFPNEVVCDGAVALLTAVIRAFTGRLTIDDYVQSYDKELPYCYVRIDVAHFLNLYAKFLKGTETRKKIRVFYKAVVGQLILARDEKSAKEILKAILIVAHSERDGNVEGSNILSECEKQKRFLIRLLKPDELKLAEESEEELEETSFPRPELPNLFDYEENDIFSNEPKNTWWKIAQDIDERAQDIAKEEYGEHESAYYLPKLAEKLKRDMKTFPMWGCVYRDRYQNGKIPASSAVVECEFKNIKTKFLDAEDLPLRADELVQLLTLRYIKGKTILYMANDNKIQKEKAIDTECAENDVPALVNSPDVKLDANMVEALCDEQVECVTGKNMCQLCQNAIGNQQEELCECCKQFKSSDAILASREIEDWGGLASKDEHNKRKNLKEKTSQNRNKSGKTSKYLDKNPDTFDALNYDELKPVPIILNGSDSSLQPVMLQKRKYNLSNTCGIDSLTQVMIVAAHDRPQIRKIVKHFQGQITIFGLVNTILNSKAGVGKSAYQKRAQILKEVMSDLDINSIRKAPMPEDGIELFEIDCQINVNNLSAILFRGLPCFVMSSSCSNGCALEDREMTSLICNYDSFFEKEFGEAIFAEEKRPCRKNRCEGSVNKTFTASGPFAFIEVDMKRRDKTTAVSIQLKNIPKSFPDCTDRKDIYTLVGVIQFIGTPEDLKCGLGQYTAICLRQNRWLEYNDLTKGKIHRMHDNDKIFPTLIIYARIEGGT